MGLWLEHYAAGMEVGVLILLTVYATSHHHRSQVQVRTYKIINVLSYLHSALI